MGASCDTCVGLCVKMRRFSSDKNGGNSFLKLGRDDDEEGLINVNIIMLSVVWNQAMDEW